MKKRKQAQMIQPVPPFERGQTLGEILAKWRSWYPFTLNNSLKDRRQRKHVEEGLVTARKLEELLELSMFAYQPIVKLCRRSNKNARTILWHAPHGAG
jgi:hypothetical protein